MKKVRYRYWLLGLSILFLIAGVRTFFINDDLRSINLTSPISSRPEWSIQQPSAKERETLEKILSQPFSYLGEGGQSTVFLSADRHYVLKLFRFRRFRPSFFVDLLSNFSWLTSYRQRHSAKREQKMVVAFNGYKLAYDVHAIESGLIFVQLNQPLKFRPIDLIDKWGFRRRVDLGKTSFVLQEKGEIFSTVLADSLSRGDLEGAKAQIDKLFNLYREEYRKGLHDLDYGIMHNIGVFQDRLFHLDVGKLIYDERIKLPEFQQKDFAKVAAKIQRWVEEYYPNYTDDVSRFLEEGIQKSE